MNKNLYEYFLRIITLAVLILIAIFLYNNDTCIMPTTARESKPQPRYKMATTTFFWVGEESNQSNNYISNSQSAWDTKWQENYGGVDIPSGRCGFKPCAFEPKENPFYFALPYYEFDEMGNLKESAKNIPWFEEIKEFKEGKSLLKNRWVEIVYQDTSCYGQWQDVGPLETDDFDYVFGDSPNPKNKFGMEAGLDVSPALWQCLGLSDNDITYWRLVEDRDVPEGPWLETITKSDIHYE